MTWSTPVQSFVFLDLLVFELEPTYATSDRRTDGRTTDADDQLMPPPYGAGHKQGNSYVMTDTTRHALPELGTGPQYAGLHTSGLGSQDQK